jgi:hypothetical protein
LLNVPGVPTAPTTQNPHRPNVGIVRYGSAVYENASAGGRQYQQLFARLNRHDVQGTCKRICLAPRRDRRAMSGGSRGGVCFVDDLAVEEVDGAFGMIGITRIVGHHADGGPGAVDVLEEFHDRVAVF